MAGHKLVSVIIPAYNIEAHIEAALTSIIDQDYDNLEVIVVNDSSSDRTRLIAQQVLSSSARPFRIIDHPHNLGVSTARNTGLDSASGEYVWFCDGDDLAMNNLVSELMSLPESDIAFGGMINRYEDGRPDEIQGVRTKSPVPIDGEEALYQRMTRPLAPTICCMLFKRAFLTEHNIRFHDGCGAFEDIEFEMKAFCRAERVSYTHECLYVYIHSAEMGSIRDNDTPAKRLGRYIDSSEAHYRTAEYLTDNAPSERTKHIADNMLMPEAVIRKFTVCARANDRDGFNSLLRNERLRRVLMSSRKAFFRKPEVFMKAFMILLLPGLYFSIRRKS